MTGDGKVKGPSSSPPQVQSYDAPQSNNGTPLDTDLAKAFRILDETKIDPDINYNSPYLNQSNDEPEGSWYFYDFDDLDDFYDLENLENLGDLDDLDDLNDLDGLDDFDGADDDILVVGEKKLLKGDDEHWIHGDLRDWFAEQEPGPYRNLDFGLSDEEAKKLGKPVGHGQDKAVDRDHGIKADIELTGEYDPDDELPWAPAPDGQDPDSVQILPGVRISKLDELLALSEVQRNQVLGRLKPDEADHIRYTLGYLARRPAFEQKCFDILSEKRSWLRRLKFWKSSPRFEVSDIPQPMNPVRVERLNQVMKKVRLGRSKFIWPKTAMRQEQWEAYQSRGDRRVAALAAENPDEFCRVFDMRKSVTPYAVAEGGKFGGAKFRHRAYAILYGMASRGASMKALQVAKLTMISFKNEEIFDGITEESFYRIITSTNTDPELFSLATGQHLGLSLDDKRDLLAAANKIQDNYTRAYGGPAADAVRADRDIGHGKILTDQLGIREKEVGYILRHVNKMLRHPPAEQALADVKIDASGSDNLNVKPKDDQGKDEHGGVIPAGADDKPADSDDHSVKEDIVDADHLDDKSPPLDPKKQGASPRPQAPRPRDDVGGQGDKYRMRMKDLIALRAFRYRSEMYGFVCLDHGEGFHDQRLDLIRAILYTIGTENPEAIADEDPQKDREKAKVLRQLTDELCSMGSSRLRAIVRALSKDVHERGDALSTAAAVVQMLYYGNADAIDGREVAEAKAKYEAMSYQEFRNLKVSDPDEYHRLVRLAEDTWWKIRRER